MATILPVLISVCRKRLSAIGASELIYSLTAHAVEVTIPPQCPASIRAEFSRFVSSSYFYWLSALLADNSVRHSITVKAIPTAKGAYRII